MDDMGKRLSKSDQLSYQSSPQLKADLATLVVRLGLERDYLGRKLSEGHVVNAIVLWLTRLPSEQADAIASHSLGMLEDMVLDRPIRSPDAVLRCEAKAPQTVDMPLPINAHGASHREHHTSQRAGRPKRRS